MGYLEYTCRGVGVASLFGGNIYYNGKNIWCFLICVLSLIKNGKVGGKNTGQIMKAFHPRKLQRYRRAAIGK